MVLTKSHTQIKHKRTDKLSICYFRKGISFLFVGLKEENMKNFNISGKEKKKISKKIKIKMFL